MTPAADSPFVAHSPSFHEVLGRAPRLWQLAEVDAHEGPVYFADENALYFTTLPRPGPNRAPLVQIKRLPLDEPEAITVLVPDANGANGMAAGPDNQLVVCEQGSRWSPARISRLDRSTGERETVVDHWRGLPLNSPNDVLVAPDGAIWFTDPSYGYIQGFRPEPQIADYVYRHDTETGDTKVVVAEGVDKPNGLALSPDGTILYIADSGANREPGSWHVNRPHHIKAYDVIGSRRLAGARLFAVTAPGVPDGVKTDRDGRVYASAMSGVQVFDPEGELIGEVRVWGTINFCFGGRQGDQLLITTDTAVWVAALAAKGA